MSDLRRFFVSKITEPLIIDGEEFRHAVSVLRIRENDRIIVCDNSGYEYIGTVTSVNKKEMEISINEKRMSDTETKATVTLIAGYLKGDKTEFVVQKATELGVKKIVIFDSEFSSAYINDNKLSRLKKVAVEAAKQCGRSVFPQVTYAENFEKALNAGVNAKNKLFACEFAKENEVEILNLEGDTAIVVGSEGGFSLDESKLAKEKGYKTVFLGKRILRAETASIALCSIIIYSLGEFK